MPHETYPACGLSTPVAQGNWSLPRESVRIHTISFVETYSRRFWNDPVPLKCRPGIWKMLRLERLSNFATISRKTNPGVDSRDHWSSIQRKAHSRCAREHLAPCRKSETREEALVRDDYF
jgi:hypothetical protein